MTNETKRRRLSASTQTTTTSAIEQQPVSSNTHIMEPDEAHSIHKGKQKADDTFSHSNQDYDDIPSNLAGNELLLHHCNTPQPCQLPNEIVSLIVNHLSEQQERLYECALVSQQFYAITNPLIWKALNFDDSFTTERFLKCISDASPQRLGTICQHIRELDLESPLWTNDHLTRLLPHIPGLKKLYIYRARKIKYKSFRYLPYHCQRLTSLCIGAGLTKLSFSAIGQYCHQLRELKWYAAKQQSLDWLEMFTSCPLEHLQLWSIHVPLTEKAMTIIKKFDRLTSLNIDHSVPGTMKPLLLPASTTTPAATTGNPTPLINPPTTIYWPQLTKLVLQRCDGIDDPTLIPFIKSHPHLRQLHLMSTKKLTDATLDAMAGCLPQLTSTTLMGNLDLSSHGIRRLVRQCHCLVNAGFRFDSKVVLEDDLARSLCSDRMLGDNDWNRWVIDQIRLRTWE